MNRYTSTGCSLVAFALVLLTSAPSAAQVKLDRFFPPVVTAGQEVEIAAEGKFPHWPVEIDSDRTELKEKGLDGTGLEITATDDTGNLRIRVGTDATPGPAWIRIRDAQSASEWFPLMITTAKVTKADEPNDALEKATKLSLPTTVAGRLEKSGDVDSFRFSLGKGQRLVASVTANQVLRSPMDAVLQLTDLDGNVLAQSEDERGLDPQLVFETDQDREVVLRMFAFPETPNSSIRFSGASSHVYTIDVTTGPFIDHAFEYADGEVAAYGENLGEGIAISRTESTVVSPPIAHADTALGWSWLPTYSEQWSIINDDGGEIAALPTVVMGHIDQPSQIDSFTLSVQKGKRYRFDVRSKPDGFHLDSHLAVFHATDGKQLAENDDRERDGWDAGLDFDAKQDASIELQIRDLVNASGPRHFYQLRLQQRLPEVKLSVAAGQFTVKAGESLKLPVTVTRQDGYSNRLEVIATDLPPGVSAEAVVSEPKGDTAKTVELKLNAAKDAANDAAFRIVAKPIAQEGQTEEAGPQDDSDAEPDVAATFELRPGVTVSEFWLSTQ
jgi:hypothetical protein